MTSRRGRTRLDGRVRGYKDENQRLEEVVLSLPILLIIIGIVLAILVHYGLGIIVILIGLVLLLMPYFRGGGRRV